MREQLTPQARAILARVLEAAGVELFRDGAGVASFRPAAGPVSSVSGRAASFSPGSAMSLNVGESSGGLNRRQPGSPSHRLENRRRPAFVRCESAQDRAGSFSR